MSNVCNGDIDILQRRLCFSEACDQGEGHCACHAKRYVIVQKCPATPCPTCFFHDLVSKFAWRRSGIRLFIVSVSARVLKLPERTPLNWKCDFCQHLHVKNLSQHGMFINWPPTLQIWAHFSAPVIWNFRSDKSVGKRSVSPLSQLFSRLHLVTCLFFFICLLLLF